MPEESSENDEPGRREWTSLWNVMGVQTLNAFNDKVAQYALIAVSAVFLQGWVKEQFPHIVSIMLSLPFVLFAPLAGWVSDRFSKRTVLIACLFAQVVIILGIAVAFKLEMFVAATIGFLLLAIQSTFFSPAKVGVVKELVGTRNLTMASGVAQMLTIVAIIVGALVGGAAFEHLEGIHGKWDAAFITIIGISIPSLVAIWAAFRVLRTPTFSSAPLQPSLLVEHFFHLGELLRDRAMRLTAIGIAYFWFAGSLLSLMTLQLGAEVALKDAASARVSSVMMGYAGVGIALGSLFVALVSRGRIELGIVPLGAVGMAACALVAAALTPTEAILSPFNVDLLFLGMFSAMFLVPLNALLQDKVDPMRRGRMLSASALMDSGAAMIAIFVQLGLLRLGVPIWSQFLLMGTMSLAAGIYVLRLLPQNFIRFVVLFLLRAVYRIRPVGAAHVPAEGGALLLPNHLSYIDAFIIQAACERTVRFVMFDQYFTVRWMAPLLKLFDVIPLSSNRAKEGIKVTARALASGDLVCVFPEGQLSRTGILNEVKKGFELIARKGGAPVVPVYIDDLWGSIFSFERGRYFWKIPYHFPYHVSVHFGDPIPPEDAGSERVRNALFELSARALAERDELNHLIEDLAERMLARSPWKVALVELSGSRRRISRSAALTTVRLLAKRWRTSIDEDRVAVLLPESSTSVLMNLALRCAGKIPVNIAVQPAFTREQMRDVLESAGIRTIVSSEKIRELLPHHHWPQNLLDMQKEIRSLPAGGRIVSRLTAYLDPRAWFGGMLGCKIERERSNEGAIGYLTTVGGAPVLRTLSHRALLSNIERIRNTNLYREREVMMNRLPYAGAGGSILGLWYPLLQGIPLINVSAKTDNDLLGRAIRDERVTWYLGDREGINTLLCEIGELDRSQIRVVMTPWRSIAFSGDEPIQICPFLAPDEHGCLITLSLPDPNTTTATMMHQAGARPDSPGHILSGTAVEVSGSDLVLRGVGLPDDGITLVSAVLDPHGFLEVPDSSKP